MGTRERLTSTRLRLAVAALLVALLATLVYSCGPDTSHYEAVLDQLHIPGGWDLVHTSTTGRFDCPLAGACPSVARYYLTSGQPIDAYAPARQMLLDAGFQIDIEDAKPCQQVGGPACLVSAVKESDWVQVMVNNPGEDLDGLGLARGGEVLVRLEAHAR